MKLFLDSRKNPEDVIPTMFLKNPDEMHIYEEKDWQICRDYPSFMAAINEYGAALTHVSFSTDIEHYVRMQHLERMEMPYEEFEQRRLLCRSAYDCARYMRSWYGARNLRIPTPFFHNESSSAELTFTNILYS
jgi:hypothetical protein